MARFNIIMAVKTEIRKSGLKIMTVTTAFSLTDKF